MLLPTIGSSGYFKLSAPFDKIILDKERYKCQAIRRISDYLANNEDIKTDIYVKNGLTDDVYDADVKEDMYIISLQALTGHWVYVPARYLTSFPDVNGVPYRSVSIGVSLPSVPVDTDFAFIEQQIKDLIKDALGVDSKTKIIETSKVLLLTKENHDTTQARRRALTTGVTDRSRYNNLLRLHQSAIQKIAELEAFIKSL